MQYGVVAWALLLLAPTLAGAVQQDEFVSLRAASDVAPSTDPSLPFWRFAHAVYADKSLDGQTVPSYRTEIRSRWTKQNLYFLFICPFEDLHLKPEPNTKSETNRLWEWDVAEVFIGSDFENIRRYKEFEISPQGEWVDLDIDLASSHHEDGWVWNSGFELAARIDPAAKRWYGALKIPFAALGRPADAGMRFRLNLFWSQAKGAKVSWQAPLSHTFHAPEKFGVLRLAEKPE